MNDCDQCLYDAHWCPIHHSDNHDCPGCTNDISPEQRIYQMNVDAWKSAVARVSPTHKERTARSYENGETESGSGRRGSYDWRQEGHGKK